MPRVTLVALLAISCSAAELPIERSSGAEPVRFQSCEDTGGYRCCRPSKKTPKVLDTALLELGAKALAERELRGGGVRDEVREEAIRLGREVYVVSDDIALTVQSPMPTHFVPSEGMVQEAALREERDMFFLRVDLGIQPMDRAPGIPAGGLTVVWGAYRYKDGKATEDTSGWDDYCAFLSKGEAVVEFQYSTVTCRFEFPASDKEGERQTPY